MAKNQQRVKDKTTEETGVGKISSGEAPVNAIVEQFIGKTGARGEVTQVKLKVLDGRNKGRSLRRNIKGLIKVGDLITLRETEIEARRIRTGGGKY